MKITADYQFSVPRDTLFAGLINPEHIQACLVGCEQLTPVGENAYEAQLKIGLPGLKGVYTGRTELHALIPPESFAVNVEGKGGPGFVRANATVRLDESEAGTDLHCETEVQVGGVLAAVGARLIPATAKKMMADFFLCLEERLIAAEGRS